MQEHHYLVPRQQQGDRLDVEHHITAETVDEAQYLFVDAKDRLLDVNGWNRYCPEIGREFHVTNNHGIGVGRHVRKHDLVRIDRPDAARAQSAGFDWVVAEAIEYDDYPDLGIETFAMRLRVTQDPQLKQPGVVADDDTSYTFVVERRGMKLYASYHGRNGAGEGAHVTMAEWECLVRALIGIGTLA